MRILYDPAAHGGVAVSVMLVGTVTLRGGLSHAEALDVAGSILSAAGVASAVFGDGRLITEGDR